MKSPLLLVVFTCVFHFLQAQLLFSEDFEDEADGATTGSAAGSAGGTWSRSYAGGGTFSKQDVAIVGNSFTGVSMGGVEGVWSTSIIDISGYGYAIIDLGSYTAFTEAGDYLNAYYIINNNGIEVPFYSQGTSFLSTSSGGSAIVSGTQLQIVVRMFNNNAADRWGIDNVQINGIATLYSTNLGGTSTWNTGTTWSTSAIGGAVSGLTPNSLTRVIIGSGYSISIPSASDAIYVEVQSGGALTWSVASDLNIGRGGINIQSGASVSSGASATAQIDFDQDYATPVVVDGSFVIGDLEVNGQPTLTVSGGGTISIVDDLIINDNTTINTSIPGTLSIGGDLNVDATSTLGGTTSVQAATLTINAGTTTFSSTGNLTVTGASTIDSFTDNENSGISTFVGLVTISGTWTTTSITTNGNLVFRGGITLGGTFNAGSATFNTNSQSLNGTSGTYSFNNAVTVTGVTVTNNRTVTISNTGTDQLTGTGTWIQGNNSTLNYAGSTLSITNFQASNTGNTVTYNSTATQTIRTPATNYYILTINNTSASIPSLSTTGNITVINTLNLTNGIINLAGNTFTLGSSGAASDLNRTASTISKWMYGGSFTRFWPTGQTPSPTAGNLYGLFPLGHSTASSYRPVAITAGSNITTTGSVTFRHADASGITDLSPVYDDDPTAGVINIVRKHNSQFIGSTSGIVGGTNYTISVTMTGLLAGTASDIRLAVSNGATTVTNVGAHVANSGTAPSPVVGRSGLTVANLTNDFRITTINSTNTPLPIELLDLNAKQVDSQVALNWSTASELNNDFFTIERLNEEVDFFDQIATVKGSGTINEARSYQAYDFVPNVGKNYYRLKQTDFDGKFTYSKILMVDFQEFGESVSVYPNPTNQETITVEVKQLKPGQQVPLQIRSTLGVQTFSAIYNADSAGTIKVNIQVDQWSQGLYFIQIGTEACIQRKMIIE